jgi:hypothetical protein
MIATYRVQFVDPEGEIAFTDPLSRENAIARACGMRLRFIVQGIVDNVTGDLVISANQIREEAHRRSRREDLHQI